MTGMHRSFTYTRLSGDVIRIQDSTMHDDLYLVETTEGITGGTSLAYIHKDILNNIEAVLNKSCLDKAVMVVTSNGKAFSRYGNRWYPSIGGSGITTEVLLDRYPDYTVALTEDESRGN